MTYYPMYTIYFKKFKDYLKEATLKLRADSSHKLENVKHAETTKVENTKKGLRSK